MEDVFKPLVVSDGHHHKQHTVTTFEDLGPSCQPLSQESASKYFTIGLVRKPCDWMLSKFISAFSGKKYEHLAIPTDESRASFKAWVSRSAFARSHELLAPARGPAPDHTRSHRRPRTVGTRSRLPCRLTGDLHAHVSLAGARARDGRR